MPTAAIVMQPAPVVPDIRSQHNPTSAAAMMQTQQQQEQEQQQSQLRRAVYVHVSDLTSSYNIDNALLEEQLAKVNAMREEKSKTTTTLPSSNSNNTTADSTSSFSDSGGGGGGGHGTNNNAGNSRFASRTAGVPTELDTSINSQKRLQPPRGGYNLCV